MRRRVGEAPRSPLPSTCARSAFEILDARLDNASSAPLAVGLSGGGDSLALLLLVSSWVRRRRPVLALCVDHGLNPESAAWTRFAGDAARRLGAGFRPLVWAGPKPSTGLAEAARTARHRLLAEAARAAGAGILLLGHTFDDVLEGEVMRAEGAAALGRLRTFSPSPVWPQGRGLFIARPLLRSRRSELRALLAEAGVPHLEDPSNEDPRFARTRARARVAADASIAGPERLEPEPTPGAGDVRALEDGGLWLPRGALLSGGSRLLAYALAAASGRETPARGLKLERMLNRGLEREGVLSLSGARAAFGGGGAHLARETGEYARAGRPALRLETGEVGVFDGRFEVTAERACVVEPLVGRLSGLSSPERARLSSMAAASRGGLPAARTAAGVELLEPYGRGPARATPLAAPRFAAAAGLVRSEREISLKTIAQA